MYTLTGPELLAPKATAHTDAHADAHADAHDAITVLAAQADQAPIVARRIARRWYLCLLLATTTVSLAVSLTAIHLEQPAQRAWAEQALATAHRSTLVDARQRVTALNEILTEQGKPTVTPPADPEDALAALSAAKVLIALPRAALVPDPTPDTASQDPPDRSARPAPR